MLQISISPAAGSILKNTHPAVFQLLIKPLTQEKETYKL